MKIAFTKPGRPKKGAVVCAVMEGGKLSSTAHEIDRETNGLIGTAIAGSRFSGKANQTLTVFTPAGRVLLLGVGDPAKIDAKFAETAGGTVYAALANSGEKEATVMIEASGEKRAEVAAHMAVGITLRSYSFDIYKTKLTKDDKPTLAKVTVSVEDHAEAKKVYDVEAAVAEGVAFTRDLVSEPPNVLFPVEFANRVAAMKDLGLKIDVLDEKQMDKLGMGALLGVGLGSERESRMVVMRWEGGPKNQKPVAFIGKGVCFDTGGYDLKPSNGMLTMKKDMGGSAQVLALARMIMAAGLPVRLRVLVPAVMNMVSGNAFLPMDICRTRKGTTVEVGNTDAEGRLVLCDALTEADSEQPDLLIDFATLTGAARVALGPDLPAMFCNDDSLANDILAGGLAEEDPLWRLPLHQPYKAMLKTKIADLSNTGSGPYGGAITAALFLEHFVSKTTPWMHVDLIAWNLRDRPGRPEGGEAQGIRATFQAIKGRFGG